MTDFSDLGNLLQHGELSLSTTPVLARVGGSNAGNREYIAIYNDGNQTIYYSNSASVSSSGSNRGWPIVKKQWAIIPVTEDHDIYVVVSSGTDSVLLQEWGYDG